MLPDGRFKIKKYNKIIREALDLSTRGCCANAFQVLLHTFVTCPKGRWCSQGHWYSQVPTNQVFPQVDHTNCASIPGV